MNQEARRLRAELRAWWLQRTLDQGLSIALVRFHQRGVNLGETCCGLFRNISGALAHFNDEEAPDPLCYTVGREMVGDVLTLTARWTTEGPDSLPFTVWKLLPVDDPLVLRLLAQTP